ncbi:MAG: CBS and ACT domain-containing protein [Chloroflexota bacterium]
MLVSERMSRHPITITEDTPIAEALKAMKDQKVRRLPVLNKDGDLVGIVSEKDLLYASPSPATSLSIHEIHYLLAKVTVKEVMTRKVITVEEDCPLEEAARIMADNKIGGLPVVRDGRLVGIITETDLFKIFLELLGAREKGVRLTLLVPEQKGMLAKLTGEFTRLGGNIVSLGTFLGEDPTNRLVAVKVSGVAQPALVQAARAAQCQVIDARET